MSTTPINAPQFRVMQRPDGEVFQVQISTDGLTWCPIENLIHTKGLAVAHAEILAAITARLPTVGSVVWKNGK